MGAAGGYAQRTGGAVMPDTAAMQQEAAQRVRRMQEHSRRLLENGPTFGMRPPDAEKPPVRHRAVDDRTLILLVLLMLSQGENNKLLLLLLGYLSL